MNGNTITKNLNEFGFSPITPAAFAQWVQTRPDAIEELKMANKITPEELRAEAWQYSLRNNGWQETPIYPGAKDDRSFKYTRNGWVVEIFNHPQYGYTRERGYGPTGERHIAICAFGPDRLSVELPENYDEVQMKANLLKCGYCGKFVESTVSIGFAGRCCPDCRKANVDKVEYPGWTN